MKINGSKVVRLALALVGLWGITVSGWARRPMRLVVLPDIQTYLEQCPEVFESQIDWIVAHRRRIDAVVQVGDLTQNNSPAEWFLVREQFRRLDRAGIPFGIAWGNHDLGSGPGKFADVHDTRLANRYFSLEEESRKKEWGGSADGMTLDNYYLSFRAAGASWLLVNLEFGPSDRALAWADSIVRCHPESYVVVNTHAYLYCDSTLLDGDDWWRPQAYGIGKEPGRAVNDGRGIWKKFVSRNSNIVAVVCGHVLKTGVGTLVSAGASGNRVYQMLANFQRGVAGSERGGNGYLRLIDFDPDRGVIDVQTYSTWEKSYHPSPAHRFTFEGVDFKSYRKR